MCIRLMRLGVIPRKSLIVKSPKDINKNHVNHFIRGVIDGDGSIRYVNRKRSPYFEIQICSGSKRFSKGLADTIKKNVGIDCKIRKAKENLYVLGYTCSRAKQLADYIYSDATLFLNRKHKPYKENVINS